MRVQELDMIIGQLSVLIVSYTVTKVNINMYVVFYKTNMILCDTFLNLSVQSSTIMVFLKEAKHFGIFFKISSLGGIQISSINKPAKFRIVL